ncbi:hypothetical protein P4S72_18775 [Vibrio sp. PP-XX7]
MAKFTSACRVAGAGAAAWLPQPVAGGCFTGAAFACLYPIFTAVLQGEMTQASHWMFFITALSVCSLGCRWYGQGFEFNGNQVRSTHELRLTLGEQLRRVPLQTLQQSRSGEMNARCCWEVSMKI